jgi:hypothetical protein
MAVEGDGRDMSFYVWTEIVCASCSEQGAGQFSSKTIDRRGLAKEAKNKGWKRVGKDWLCSKCSTSHKKVKSGEMEG